MANRRPASSRAKINYGQMQPPTHPQNSHRSKSVMSKSSSSRATDEASEPATTVLKNQRNAEDAESNIQVVLRCRRRSEREIQDNSPIIVSSTGAKSKEISIETSAPVSSLGVVTLPPVRIYPFDVVFGPEADQALIYHEVVHPMLEEVLLGYNCTLFAYGQTGTGKTYTMQGDLNPTPMGNPSTGAGMIPRVLFRLFHQLESSHADYSVKISFIELYNEELRDLLSNEFAAPMSSTQPMGLAAKDSKITDNGLKIFDDANKRGVFIQGLEEIPVKDSKDALALLLKGSQRRQIAATKFNDHSSRSHSVFSITVHTKETSTIGDDLLKIGKLNLVDLAGSENIGRSGAENKRAREAGMINQSLLTLGRVINALVDKAQHIPYRESKLTRLLQDSLGGCTKTCIIATISPARSNMEETLSTLDYAMRAKSIRNKPELNQRMTRNSLLKEYIAEIERLKADLLAAREKNGIFFSEETWNELNAEHEMSKTEAIEAKKQVEIVESQIRAVRDEFEQSIALLMKTDGELKETRDRLKEKEEALVNTEQELILVKENLEDEIIVRSAHQDTEHVLDGVATNLKNVATEGLSDLEQLFAKLERLAEVLSSNVRTVSTTEGIISTSATTLSKTLAEFNKFIPQVITKLQAEAKQIESSEIAVLDQRTERMKKQVNRLEELITTIQSLDKSETESLENGRRIIAEAHISFKAQVTAWNEQLQTTHSQICQRVQESGEEKVDIVLKALNELNSLIEVVIHKVIEFLATERDSLLESRVTIQHAANQEISHLRKQNEVLMQMLTNERIEADKAKNTLIQRVSGLLEDFTRDRDNRLKDAVGIIHDRNGNAESLMRESAEKHSAIIGQFETHFTDLTGILQQKATQAKRTRDGTLKDTTSAKALFKQNIDHAQSTLSNALQMHSTWIHTQSKRMATSYAETFDNHMISKRARLDTFASLDSDVHSTYRWTQDQFGSTSKNIQKFTGRVMTDSSELSNHAQRYDGSFTSQLSSIRRASRTLVEQGMREDTSTSMTPRKRKWSYIKHWDLTKTREELLKDRLRHRSPTPHQHPQPEQDILRSEDSPEETRLLPYYAKAEQDREDIETAPSLQSSTMSVPFQSQVSQKDAAITKQPTQPTFPPVTGTLTESRKTNVITTRRSRRIR